MMVAVFVAGGLTGATLMLVCVALLSIFTEPFNDN